MNRESYIKAREENSIEIMYMFYKEHFIKEKHVNFLEFPQFVEYIQMWPFVQQAFHVSCEYYDSKFNILHIPLQNKTLYI